MKRRGLLEAVSRTENALSQIGEILLIANRVTGAVVNKCRRGAEKPFRGRLASAKAPWRRLFGIDVEVLEHDEASCQGGPDGAIEVSLGNDLKGIKTHVYRIACGASGDNPDRGSAPEPSRKGTDGPAMEHAA